LLSAPPGVGGRHRPGLHRAPPPAGGAGARLGDRRGRRAPAPPARRRPAARGVPDTVKTLDVDTPTGPARVHLRPADQPRGGVAPGHGAGGGVEAVDLVAATDGALDSGFSVALIEQPYRVAGKRAPAAAKRLDEAWIAVLEHLRSEQLAGLPLVVGGRSLGARV